MSKGYEVTAKNDSDSYGDYARIEVGSMYRDSEESRKAAAKMLTDAYNRAMEMLGQEPEPPQSEPPMVEISLHNVSGHPIQRWAVLATRGNHQLLLSAVNDVRVSGIIVSVR